MKKKHQASQVEYPEVVYKDIRLDKITYEKLSEWARVQRISERKALARLLHYGAKYYTELQLRSQNEHILVPGDSTETPTVCGYKHFYLDKDSWELLDYWAHQRKLPKTLGAGVLIRYGIAYDAIARRNLAKVRHPSYSAKEILRRIAPEAVKYY